MALRSTDFARDAIAILKAHHQELLGQFEQLFKLGQRHERQRGWRALSAALRLHVEIEAEVFYPAFLDATEDSLTHFVASVGHENIAAEMQDVLDEPATGADFVARMRALKKIFKHHVADMERDGGMFDEARRSTMDHDTIARLVRAHFAIRGEATDHGTKHIHRVQQI
jgi:hypothetical protein